MSNTPSIIKLAAAAQYVEVRNQIRVFSACLAGIGVAVAVTLIVVSSGMGETWIVAIAAPALISALAFLAFVKPHPILGFVVAGTCLLISAAGILFCLSYAANSTGGADASVALGCGISSVIGYEGLRLARLSWRVVAFARQPGIGVAVEEVREMMKLSGSDNSLQRTVVDFTYSVGMSRRCRVHLDDSEVVLAVRDRRYPQICTREEFDIVSLGKVRERGNIRVRIRLGNQVVKTKISAVSFRNYMQWQRAGNGLGCRVK
jgi:hypothetical protein